MPSGLLEVRPTKIQGPEWVRAFRRWSLRIECNTVDEPGEVSAFFNMGSDPTRPKIGRQSNYYKAWVLANGGAPMKGEEMSPDVFLHKYFRVRIGQSTKDKSGADKPEAEVYSKITEFVERTHVAWRQS